VDEIMGGKLKTVKINNFDDIKKKVNKLNKIYVLRMIM